MGTNYCPEKWKLVKLGDLGEVNRGRSRHRPRYAEHLYGGPYPFIQTGDIKASGGKITIYQQTYSKAGLAQSRLWPAGTMCITIAANIAETGILTFPACFPDSVVGFIPDHSKCDVRFIEYTFRYLKRRIQHEATGSVQDNINLATLDRLWFPLPPLSEQKAIAHILGTLDDKIELNQQMNRKLEVIAQTIFKSWFVDFDPVHAKMEGRQPVGIDAATAALFPDSFEDLSLGKIPKDWRVGKLGEIAHIVMGQSPPGETYNELGDGLPFYQGVRDFGFRFPTRRVYCTAPTRFAEKGDVLFSVRAPVGNLNVAVEHCVIGRGVAALRLKAKHSSFLYYFLKATQSDWEKFEAEGTVFGSVSKNDIHGFKLIVPISIVVEHFNDLIASIDTRIESNEQQSRTLTTIRDTLLPKLMTGEIRVKEAEKIVEAVA